VYVDGAVSVSTYEAKDGTTKASMDVMANDVEFLSPRETNDGSDEGSVNEEESPFE
jgi:single-stranded DNA-binding protein